MSDDPTIEAQLAAAVALVEPTFLAAGQSLEAAIAILDHLTARFAEYVAELSGEAIGDTRRDLAAAAGHVAALGEARRSDATSLGAMDAIVTAIAARLGALQPITREVETLSLSARVVAGGMGEVAGDFSRFAGDIRDAAQRARTCLDAAGDELRQVTQGLTAGRLAEAAFSQRHGEAVQAIPRRLQHNLQNLTAQQQRAAAAATTAHRESDAIRRQVATQIVALQLGDITRQRLEHVQAAMQLFSAVEPPGALLAAQLADAAKDLLHDGQEIEDGLRELGAAAGLIGQLGGQLHGQASGGGFVAALQSDLQQTAALVAELTEGDAANDRRMAGVLESAEALAGRLSIVQTVQEDLRIMALNATLKCGRLGAVGRPLAAVAQELRQGSARFEGHAAAVLHELARLRPLAAALCDTSRRERHATLAAATEELLLPLQRLQQLEHELAVTLAQLRHDAAEVVRLVDATLAQFASRHSLVELLQALVARLAALPRVPNESHDRLDRIASIYTMAQERAVHARFAPLPEIRAEALDDVLF